jgi:hypothetical protein
MESCPLPPPRANFVGFSKRRKGFPERELSTNPNKPKPLHAFLYVYFYKHNNLHFVRSLFAQQRPVNAFPEDAADNRGQPEQLQLMQSPSADEDGGAGAACRVDGEVCDRDMAGFK